MPSSIALTNLAWSTPDSRPLFHDIQLSFGPERTGLVGRNGVGKTTLLKLITGEQSPTAGKVVIHGSLGVLRQTIQSQLGQTVADLFGVSTALATLDRIERGEGSADDFADADWTLESRIAVALERVGLADCPNSLLANLSGGQQTRVGLAALLFSEPDFLLLDEPTNNLDREGRAAILQLLSNWRSGAIVISHDRELLEMMDAIIELTSLGATRYGGNWSTYRQLKSQELAAAQQDLADAEKRAEEIARRAQATTDRQARRSAAGKRTGAKGGIPRILNGGRQDRSEKTSGENTRRSQERRQQAEEAAAAASKRIEILQPLTVQLESTQLPASKLLLKLDAVTTGYEPDQPIIRDLSLQIVGPERISVTGPNGSGKSTLLALITGLLSPWRGEVYLGTDFALLDQQMSLLDPTSSIRDNFLRLNPQTTENECRRALAKFLFRADSAMQIAGTLSGGQMLRAGLACAVGGPTPQSLLLLDEPTNHLDIESIEAVEAGLRAYDGAFVVVSHDASFLDAIGIDRRLEMRRDSTP